MLVFLIVAREKQLHIIRRLLQCELLQLRARPGVLCTHQIYMYIHVKLRTQQSALKARKE